MNNSFTAYAPLTGEVLYSGTASDIAILATDGVAILAGEKFEGGWLDNGIHFEQPVKPSNHHSFNWVTKQWHDPRTLQDLKDAQWTAIKQSRSAAEYAGFTWDGSVFDSDALSQNRITGAVTLAQMSAEFSIGWTLKNNTVRTLNQMDMLQVGASLGSHVASVFAKGVQLRGQIEAATDAATLAPILW